MYVTGDLLLVAGVIFLSSTLYSSQFVVLQGRTHHAQHHDSHRVRGGFIRGIHKLGKLLSVVPMRVLVVAALSGHATSRGRKQMPREAEAKLDMGFFADRKANVSEYDCILNAGLMRLGLADVTVPAELK
jgi:hypothetical protein